jgi:hypothetical protein
MLPVMADRPTAVTVVGARVALTGPLTIGWPAADAAVFGKVALRPPVIAGSEVN